MALKEQLRKGVQQIRSFLKKYFDNDNEYLPYLIPLIVGLVIAGLTLTGFLELFDSLREDELTGFDTAIAEYVQSFHSPELTNVFTAITDLGNLMGYLVLVVLISAFLFFRYKSWKFPMQISVVLVLASFVNLVLKRVINRERPSGEHMVEVITLSFPSGHAMSAMAFYGFLIYLIWRYIKHSWWKVTLIMVCVFLILGIGISRIYLGVHYPSDIVAGYTGGLFWVAVCIIAFNLLSLLRRKKEKGGLTEEQTAPIYSGNQKSSDVESQD